MEPRLNFICFGDRPDDIACALRMIRSVRKAMPGMEIVQQTDHASKPVKGVDDVARLSFTEYDTFCSFRARHDCLVGDSPTIFCDVDMIFLRDVSYLFTRPFSIAMTVREDDDPLKPTQRYVGGFVLSQEKLFWRDVLNAVMLLPAPARLWYAGQDAWNRLAPNYPGMMELPAWQFNYAPKSADDVPASAFVLHFRGKRKAWMIERYQP